MADKFQPNTFDIDDINNGDKFTAQDGITPEAINAPIESALFMQKLGTNQPDNSKAGNVGTPMVSIEQAEDGSPRFKFVNIKGEQGEQGIQGIQGEKGEKGEKGDKGEPRDDYKYGKNLISPDDFEYGNINYLTGANNNVNGIRTRDYIELESGATYTLSITAEQTPVPFYGLYIIFYGENYAYDSYINNNAFSGITPKYLNFTVPSAAKYIRIRIELNSGVDGKSIDISKAMKFMLTAGVSPCYSYFEKNKFGGYVLDAVAELRDYEIQQSFSHLYNYDEADAKTTAISNAIREMYVPDETLKGKLALCVFRREANSWQIRLYNVAGSSPVLIYEFSVTTSPETLSGLSLVELKRVDDTTLESGFALVDWSAVEFGTAYSSMIALTYLVRDSVFYLPENSFLYYQLKVKPVGIESDGVGLDLAIDELKAGTVETGLVKVSRNFSVPTDKNAVYLSTDIFATKNLSNATDEVKEKSLIPYLYFNGEKIGTLVLYDDNGEPYIYDKNGAKLRLSYARI